MFNTYARIRYANKVVRAIKTNRKDYDMEKEKVVYGYQFNKTNVFGYYEVLFYDDDGKNKNHWLSGNQVQYFLDRNDALKYVDEVRQWNAIKFSQYLIRKIS